jgi:hypothetical protein
MAAEDAKKKAEDAKKKAEEEAKKKKAEEAKVAQAKEVTERANAEKAKASEAPKRQEESKDSISIDAGRGNKSGFGVDKNGNFDQNRAIIERDNAVSKASAFAVDPYATRLYGRSFRQATPKQRNSGDFRGTAVEAAELRQAGQQNLKNDVDYLVRQFNVGESRLGLGAMEVGAKNEYQRNEVAKIIQEKTGVKVEPTGGAGNYSERDMGKLLATPEAKQYMDSVKTGSIKPEMRQQPSGTLSEQKAQSMNETAARLANNKTDFTKDVERIASGNPNLTPVKDTTKGPRLDTRSNANIVSSRRQDPLQSISSNIRVKNEYGGADPLEPKTRELRKPGMYDPALGTEGSLAYAKYGNVPTNKPATSVGELTTRMGALEKDRMANTEARATRQAKMDAGTLKRGATLPGGEFIANQPKQKAGMETDAQRIARREKEEGVGRFAGSKMMASTPSYFDDKSRGRRI